MGFSLWSLLGLFLEAEGFQERLLLHSEGTCILSSSTHTQELRCSAAPHIPNLVLLSLWALNPTDPVQIQYWSFLHCFYHCFSKS